MTMHATGWVASAAITLCLAALGAGLFAMGGSPALAEEPPTLRFNPFRTSTPEPSPNATAPARAETRAFAPILYSTALGGGRPIVNLGGEILTLGETAGGYRLIEVRPFEAVFEHQGEWITLDVEARPETSP